MIYFLRHGLDDETYIGGWSDVDLLPTGILQVKKVAITIKKNLDIKQIYSSDIKRCRSSTEIIKSKINVPIIYTEKLRELDKGIITGLAVEKAKLFYPKYFKDVTIDTRYPNGESLLDLYKRVKILLDEIMTLDNSLIVTHRGVINMIYFILNDIPLNMNKEQFNVTHASLHQLNQKTKKITKIDRMV